MKGTEAKRAKRTVAPWKHTDRDRGWLRRRAAADDRLEAHTYDPERCGPNCPKRAD